MFCERVDAGNGVVAIACFSGKRARCGFCDVTMVKLCDGPPRGKAKNGCCDKPLCKAHATSVGEDRDLCPDCVADAARAAAGPLTTTIEVWTSRLDPRQTDPDLLDTTRLSGKPDAGLPFAPTWAIVKPAIAAFRRANEAALAGMFHDALNIELDAWNAYVPQYLAEMLVSSNSQVPEKYRAAVREAWARGVRPNPEAWVRLLARPRVVLACLCQNARQHCHRFLLARILGKLGATLKGELPLPAAPPSSQLSLIGEVARG
jgi:hypothetical protein